MSGFEGNAPEIVFLVFVSIFGKFLGTWFFVDGFSISG